LSNQGDFDLWVNLFFLSGDCGIDLYKKVSQIQAGEKAGPFRATITPEGLGTEGFVVFAIPQQVSRGQPDFDFLTQDGLKSQSRKLPPGPEDVAKAPQTPFGRLLMGVALGRGTTRDLPLNQPSNPAMLSWSWVTQAPEHRLGVGNK
jgi:hypothetical protein